MFAGNFYLYLGHLCRRWKVVVGDSISLQKNWDWSVLTGENSNQRAPECDALANQVLSVGCPSSSKVQRRILSRNESTFLRTGSKWLSGRRDWGSRRWKSRKVERRCNKKFKRCFCKVFFQNVAKLNLNLNMVLRFYTGIIGTRNI